METGDTERERALVGSSQAAYFPGLVSPFETESPCCLISPCVNWPGAITRRYNLGGLNNRNLLSIRSRGWNRGRAGMQRAA